MSVNITLHTRIACTQCYMREIMFLFIHTMTLCYDVSKENLMMIVSMNGEGYMPLVHRACCIIRRNRVPKDFLSAKRQEKEGGSPPD